MLQVGVLGATGYAGYELVKIIQRHPQAELAFVSSQSYAGQRYSAIYPCPYEMTLVAPDEAPLDKADVVFLCTPHAASAPYAKQAVDAGAKCVDLSADFRLHDADIYAQWYVEHPLPEMLDQAVYGLTEIYRDQIAETDLVANPGCYPTGPLLALYPLLQKGLVSDSRIIVDAKSGVSGAGAKASPTTHYVNVNENLSAYKVGHSHRHAPEMEQELTLFADKPMRVTFVPHLLPVTRGILSTIYANFGKATTVSDVIALWQETYAGEPFVLVCQEGKLATVAHAAHTNRCAISIASAGAPGEFVIVTAIDNLLKGASGQAVQNMNVMFGLDETAGLLA